MIQNYIPETLDKISQIVNSKLKDRSPKYCKIYGVKGIENYKYFVDNKIEEIEYCYNNVGYRDYLDIDGTEDIIAIGDSQTFGYALPERYRWTNLLSSMSGLKVANLGFPGDSAAGAIDKAIAYCKEYGNPKFILAVLPIQRIDVLSINDKFVTKIHQRNIVHINDQLMISSAMPARGSVFPKISQSPYIADETIPIEHAIYASLNYIKIFNEYCLNNNIKFIWTATEEYDKIFNIGHQVLVEDCKSLLIKDCHTEIENEFYDWAADFVKDSGHNGIHWNMHCAEEFYKTISLCSSEDRAGLF